MFDVVAHMDVIKITVCVWPNLLKSTDVVLLICDIKMEMQLGLSQPTLVCNTCVVHLFPMLVMCNGLCSLEADSIRKFALQRCLSSDGA